MFKIFKKPYSLLKRLFFKFYHKYYYFLYSKEKIQKINEDIVVSLTTHGDRLNTVHITIASILKGNILPAKIILWLDDDKLFNLIPKELSELCSKGLEIKKTNNYGPHTKYYPYIAMGDFDHLLVTADDDIIYPVFWLENLIKENVKYPNSICCYRAHFILFDDENTFSKYTKWHQCINNRKASYRYFATGVSGVIYPKAFQKNLADAGDSFLNICRNQDDVWLHFMAVKNNYLIKQVGLIPFHFPLIPNTQYLGLCNINVTNEKNDEWIKATYSLDVIHKIYYYD